MFKQSKDPLHWLRQLLGIGADQTHVTLASAKPEAGAGIFAIEHPGPYAQTQIKFRAIEVVGHAQRLTDLRLLQTAQLLLPNGNALALFADPTQTVRAEHAAAQAKVAELEAQVANFEKHVAKSVEEIKVELGITLDRGDLTAHAVLAQKAAGLNRQRESGRIRLDMDLRSAQAELDRTTANVKLLDKGIAHRHLKIEPCGGMLDDRIVCSENLTIDLAKVEEVDWRLKVSALPVLPLNCLQYIVPLQLPSVAAWVSECFEPVDPRSPASAGIGASELHEQFLREHGLRVDQVSATRFGNELRDAGVVKKDHKAGIRYMLTRALTEAQREAQLRAEFAAEKAERERREFEQWKASRTKETDHAAAE